MNWHDISYLLDGNDRQKKAYHILQKLQIFEYINEYQPVLVGTIPINIDIDSSDLDIICQVYDLSVFELLLKYRYGTYENFRIKRKWIDGLESVISKLIIEDIPVEIFGQPRPVVLQAAYCHMCIEAKLLKQGGENVRQEILKLKRNGLKTEPAFAQYFGLEGDPYQTLYALWRG